MINPISFLFSFIKWLIRFLANLITLESYEYLKDNDIIRHSLTGFIIIVGILCFVLILINSFRGISNILNDLFDIDSYKYIDVFNIDLDNNFHKMYLPEFIISCIGLASIIGILLYTISADKYNEKHNIASVDPEFKLTDDSTAGTTSTAEEITSNTDQNK
jgi:hypothetical protein